MYYKWIHRVFCKQKQKNYYISKTHSPIISNLPLPICLIFSIWVLLRHLHLTFILFPLLICLFHLIIICPLLIKLRYINFSYLGFLQNYYNFLLLLRFGLNLLRFRLNLLILLTIFHTFILMIFLHYNKNLKKQLWPKQSLPEIC